MDAGMRQNYGVVNFSLLEKALATIKLGLFKAEQVKAYEQKTKHGYVFGTEELSLDGGSFEDTYRNSKKIDGGRW